MSKVLEEAAYDVIDREATVKAIEGLKEKIIYDDGDEIYNRALDHAINEIKNHVKSIHFPRKCIGCKYKELAIYHCMMEDLKRGEK